MSTAKIRLADRTTAQLESSAASFRRFGGIYVRDALVFEELADRRRAMGYTDPELAATNEAKATTPRRAMIDRFVDAHAEPAEESTDATR